jgi:hypothetical protein
MTQEEKFDLILFDLNYEEDGDLGISPPPKFYTTEFLNKLV